MSERSREPEGAGQLLTRYPLHPLLVAISFVLVATFDSAVFASSALRALLLAAAITMVATLVAAAVLRNRHRGATIVTALVGAMAAKVPFLLFLDRLVGAPSWIQTLAIVLLPIAAVWLGVVGVRAIEHRRAWARVTQVGNTFALLLLAVVLANGVTTGSVAQAWTDLASSHTTAKRQPTADAPNMYILLLDGYARADTLQRVMRYDNSAFLSALSARGFDVSTRSKSNYTFTEMTLPSMFHMAYLRDIPELDGVISGRLPPQPAIRNAINRSPVLDDLREHGYSIVTTATGTSGYVSIRNSDVYLDTGEMNEFEFHLIRSTWLLDFIQFTGSDFLLDQHRDRIESVLDAIQQEASVTPDGPRFLFAHVLAPHAPHVFAVDGRVLARSDSEFYNDIAAEHRDGGPDWGRGYVAGLEYLNGRVVDIVDTITTHDPSAVVIVMSDHGSASQWNPLDPNSDPTERFTNLFAARTPGHDALFGDQAMPVNVFAELFNTYFGEHRPALQPRFFLGYDEEIADPEAGGTER